MEDKMFCYDVASCKLVQCNDRNDFLKLCQKIHHEEFSDLFSICSKNPYALLMATRLNELGFNDKDIMTPFLNLKSFCGYIIPEKLVYEPRRGGFLRIATYGSHIFHDDNAMRAYRLDVHYSQGDWNVLSFYCHWQLSMKPEKVVAKGFYKMLQDWQPDYMEAMKSISDNYLNLSNELRHDILENGLNAVTCQLINEEVKKIGFTEKITYTANQLSYQCEIDGFIFRLLTSGEAFYKGCYPYSQVIRGHSVCDGMLLVGIYKGEKLKACFELLQGVVERFEPKSHSPGLNEAKIWIAFLHWLKWTGLAEEYWNADEDDICYLEDEVVGKPLSGYSKPIDEKGAMQHA